MPLDFFNVGFTGTPRSKPDTPSAPSASTSGGTNTITWSAPNSHASPIDVYNVYRNGVYLKQVAASPTTDGTGTLGVSYNYAVEAHNAIGWSGLSSNSNSVTPATAPSAPVIGTASDNLNGTITANWSAATANGSAVTNYEVYANGSLVTTVGNVLSYIHSITLGNSYYYSVKAINAIGTSSASSNSNTVTTIVPSLFVSGLGSAVNKTEVGAVGRLAHTDFPTASQDYAWGTFALANYAIKTDAPTAIVDLQAGTWNLWFKLTVTTTLQTLACVGNPVASGARDSYWVFYRGDLAAGSKRLELEMDINAVRVLSVWGNQQVTNTNWHMMTVSSNGSTIKIYLDGTLQTLTFGSGSNSGQFFGDCPAAKNLLDGVGYSSDNIVNAFTGYLDDHAIWDSQLITPNL